MEVARWAGFEDELEPVVATERTDYGWRGITADGQILEVKSTTGVPEAITEFRDGKPIGRRTVVAENGISIAGYLAAFDLAAVYHRENQNIEALAAIERAIEVVPTARARFNRSMILLALGRWREGFAEYELCEREPPFQRPMSRRALDLGLKPWRGEALAGRRLLIVHDHGFGDAIMTLRFVAVFRRRGADVVLAVPPELERIAKQFGHVTTIEPPDNCDYFTSFLQLLRWLEVGPGDVPQGTYVKVDPALQASWRDQLGRTTRRRIGIAWSTRVTHSGDFPRELPLEEFVSRFPDAELHSVQKQDAERATTLGVLTHDLADFASAAALMSILDEVVSVDTAAIHVAGAIGHSCATVLLPRWHSWRWHGNPFYPNVRIAESGR